MRETFGQEGGDEGGGGHLLDVFHYTSHEKNSKAQYRSVRFPGVGVVPMYAFLLSVFLCKFTLKQIYRSQPRRWSGYQRQQLHLPRKRAATIRFQ